MSGRKGVCSPSGTQLLTIINRAFFSYISSSRRFVTYSNLSQ